MLCRALIQRQYGQYGGFRALANQPGVEFHLKIHSSCCLGDAGRWYGWQCRWYELPSGSAIGSTRRRKIKEAVDKSKEVLPELTDWVLWTRHPLTAGDQAWFYALETHMKLALWTSAEIEDQLSGSAEILRSAYFGELVLTRGTLRDLHKASVAPIKGRWLPEVHQVVEAERVLSRALGASSAWSDLSKLAAQIDKGVKAVRDSTRTLEGPLAANAASLCHEASSLSDSLVQSETALRRGDFEVLREQFANHVCPSKGWSIFPRKLRAARHRLALHATNLLADMYQSVHALGELDRALSRGIVAAIGDAGYGKTQLAAQLTSEND